MQKGFTAKQHVDKILQTVADVHGFSPDEILNEGDKISRKELQRAKNHFRYILSQHVGLREAARMLGCAPATIFYARQVYKTKHGNDFYYTELLNEILKKL